MKLSSREIAGISLWWAEGTKSRRDKRWKSAVSYPVEVTNTDPHVLKMFLLFLRQDIKIDESKLRVQVQIHEGDDQKALENYWSEITGIPISCFNKTIVRPLGKKPGKSMGTCKVRFSDKETYNKLEALWSALVADVLKTKKHPVN